MHDNGVAVNEAVAVEPAIVRFEFRQCEQRPLRVFLVGGPVFRTAARGDVQLVNADGTVEFARSDFDPAVLKVCRERLIMFGCIDPGGTPAPSVDAVKARVRQALRHLDPQCLLLAPDCGLMTISRDLAREKLQVMVEAAVALRREL